MCREHARFRIVAIVARVCKRLDCNGLVSPHRPSRPAADGSGIGHRAPRICFRPAAPTPPWPKRQRGLSPEVGAAYNR